HKAKNGLAIIGINIKRTKAEIEAVNKLRQRLEDGEDLDLDIKDKSGTITQKISQMDKVLQYKYSEDWQIYIGRKAKENDFVTTKIGKPQDWWFHSRIYRGAHVLLRNLKKQELPPELLRQCASLAAWYSQAKFSVNVPVDYTQIRYVRKPKGSAAGFVTYTNYKTYFATPQDLRGLRKELEA
ncbi:MAG: NFACT RNA binding domain-containing protein, partial [Candidatus Cloacimonadaceae bacterium]